MAYPCNGKLSSHKQEWNVIHATNGCNMNTLQSGKEARQMSSMVPIIGKGQIGKFRDKGWTGGCWGLRGGRQHGGRGHW